MSIQERILVMDDEPEWLEILTGTLTAGGFHVDTATTTARTLELLEESFYHLLILDIRMDGHEASDMDGMDMLRELSKRGISGSMAIIMFSAYGTLAQMREAFSQYAVADFMSKEDFEKKEFLASIQEIFDKKICNNPNLIIHWLQATDPKQIVINLEIDQKRVKRNTPLQTRIVEELNELLARLFFDASSLVVRPLAPGFSGSSVLWVQPFFLTEGGGQAVVVKFGDFRGIDREYHNFEKHVQPFIGGGRSTNVLRVRRTPKLGGIVYSMLGASSDHIESFGSFYSHADIARINGVLDRLFLDTCKPWYANRSVLNPLNLTKHYKELLDFSTDKLERALSEGLKSIQGKHKLHCSSLKQDRTFTNPILATADQEFIKSTYVCKTHGDLNENNILVDDAGQVWLIDFESTGPGHILRDIAELDSVVRFQLLKVEEATLDERLKMEEALLSVDSFKGMSNMASEMGSGNEALEKAFAVTAHLRVLASQLVLQNPIDDIGDYYVPLLYFAMNSIRFYQLPALQRQHALLSASLLADYLEL